MSPLTKEEAFGPMLIGYDGTATRLSDESYRTMRTVLRVIDGGKKDEAEVDPLLTTGQAAEILEVSRRSVARYLDADAMPYERSGGGHRMVRLSAVLEYKDERARRREALDRMREIAVEGGLYDLDLSDELFDHFDGSEQ